jgi:general secretion pathway protein D
MPSKPAFLLGISTLAAAVSLSPVLAQQAGVQGAAAREIHRRELVSNFAQDAITKGNEALQSQDYESAYAYFKSAVDALPSGGPATQKEHDEAMNGFEQAVIKLAKQRISEGRYQDAETTLNVILEEQYEPNYQPALSLLAKIKSGDYFNMTITPGFVANVEQVKQYLREAEGFYQSGRYDLAFKRCEQVLNIDKYNIAARRLMERIDNARQDYAGAAYNETRAQMISKVEGAWELPVTKFETGNSQLIEQPVIDTHGTASINRKLEEIRIPSINFREATVREALNYIKMRAEALDTQEPDPAKRGINIVLKPDPANQDASTRITLSLTDVPLGEALKYIATAANLKVKIEPYAVAVVPLNEQTDVLITKEYKVSPSFISQLPGGGGGATADAGAGGAGGFGGFGGGAATGGGAAAPVVSKAGAKEYLEANGVTFPPGSSATYLTSSSKLIVRNTQANLDLIDSLVEADQTVPSQVQIETKFVEITQNNLKELGFDWLLGQFAMPFGSGVYGGGGTTSGNVSLNGTVSDSSGNLSNTAYPFIDPSTGVPVGAASSYNGTLTGGNRTGSTAISVNALDGLLFGSPAGPAPGILALAGVFTNPQFQVVLRALDQQKGIDLMSAPKVTAKSGQTAKISIVREFKYPTQFDPPQIPQTVGSGFTPVTPTTPSAFDMRPLGVELEVQPTIGPDGYTIDLNLSPRVTEFDGFINYGSPIYTTARQASEDLVSTSNGGITAFGFVTRLGQQSRILVSENTINQPIFSVRQVTTQVTIYDGQTVVLGGLMREDVQKVEDKTPIIGDIPLVGRLFRTSADQHIKRNLIMFVTANLIDPAGQPLIKQIEDGDEVAAPDLKASADQAVPGDSTSGPALPAPTR